MIAKAVRLIMTVREKESADLSLKKKSESAKGFLNASVCGFIRTDDCVEVNAPSEIGERLSIALFIFFDKLVYIISA